MKEDQSASLLSLSYPRTGKRGVPQQFPRRLYEMLECETKAADTTPGYPRIITWSDSGKAFRIVNVKLFCSQVLGKYFRTSKLSSFQRNLNLYGFSKLRRGPGTDMYGHPAFIRGQRERLSELRKLTTKPGSAPTGNHGTSASPRPARHIQSSVVHVVPPSPPPQVTTTVRDVTTLFPNIFRINDGLPSLPATFGESMRSSIVPKFSVPKEVPKRNFTPIAPRISSRGRLDLLTLALEREVLIEATTP